MSGPPPKPNARRRNERPVETITLNLNELQEHEVEIPAPDDSWHPIAHRLYISLTESVVARLYEPSDWMTAYALCEDYSRELKPRKVQVGVDGAGEPILVEMECPMPGAKLNALLKGLSGLIATEGDRRRLQIEVKRNGQLQHGDDAKSAAKKVTQDRKLALVKKPA